MRRLISFATAYTQLFLKFYKTAQNLLGKKIILMDSVLYISPHPVSGRFNIAKYLFQITRISCHSSRFTPPLYSAANASVCSGADIRWRGNLFAAANFSLNGLLCLGQYSEEFGWQVSLRLAYAIYF